MYIVLCTYFIRMCMYVTHLLVSPISLDLNILLHVDIREDTHVHEFTGI